MSVQPLFTPVRMGELDLPNSYRHGTAHPHARWADRSHADRAAGRVTRGLAVHPGDAVFVSSGGDLPRNFVDGPIIWKGIYL
jgi:hypothetical protein